MIDIIDYWRIRARNLKRSLKGKSDLLLPNRKRSKTPRYYLSAISFVRDEAHYLDEWINFHLMVGCDHLYFYDNDSSDETREILKTYARKGVVTYRHWKGQQKQAYYHAINKYGNDSRWMMFVDIDEFVFPGKEDSLKTVLRGLEQYPCVVLPWHMFGDDGHTEQPEGLVIENYCSRARIPSSKISDNMRNKLTHTKCIVDPFGIKTVGVHMFTPRSEDEPVTSNGASWNKETWVPSDEDEIVLNHYYTRSQEEFRGKLKKKMDRHERERIKKPRVEKYEGSKQIAAAISADTVEDHRIQKFVEPLKHLMTRESREL